MLLANSSVSGKAATGHVLIVRSHRRLSPNTRSSSKIIAPNRVPLVFRNELRKCVRTSHVGGSFFCGERGGDRSIGEANLRKGRQPLQWKRHCRPLQWKRYRRPPSLFIQNGFARLVALRGRGARLPQRGQAPWRLAKPMRLPPKFPHMEFCIYPNKMPTHFILPESLIL